MLCFYHNENNAGKYKRMHRGERETDYFLKSLAMGSSNPVNPAPPGKRGVTPGGAGSQHLN